MVHVGFGEPPPPPIRPGDELVEASLDVNYHGLHRRFATHNVHRWPHSIEMHLAEGPLSHLDGFWKFEELRDGRCRAEFFLEYGFSGRFLNGLVGGVFRRIFENFADAFIVRAREIYPPPPLLSMKANSESAKFLAVNRRAEHNYFIAERFEAGVSLLGWEVKAMRGGRAQLHESYVVVSGAELHLLNCHVSPLISASTHVQPDPSRSRKLLLHRREIRRLIGRVREAGWTLLPLNLHLTRGKIKVEVGLAKGKRQHDKRESIRNKEWAREKQRLLKGAGASHRGGKKSPAD